MRDRLKGRASGCGAILREEARHEARALRGRIVIAPGRAITGGNGGAEMREGFRHTAGGQESTLPYEEKGKKKQAPVTSRRLPLACLLLRGKTLLTISVAARPFAALRSGLLLLRGRGRFSR